MDELQYKKYIDTSYKRSSFSRGIEDLFSIITGTKINKGNNKEKVSKIAKCGNILQSFITNPILNSYIIERKFNKLRKGKVKECRGKNNIYFTRTGKFNSRVMNEEEITKLLLARGFEMCDPSSYTTSELIDKLLDASIIITEAGTSCLVASMYAPNSANIIALVPGDFLTNPTSDMIMSGLPYHFTKPNNTSFILGEPVEEHQIQTSQMCWYSPSEVQSEINRLFG